MIFSKDDVQIAKRLSDAVMAVSAIATGDDRVRAACGLIGMGIGELFDQEFTPDAIRNVVEDILHNYPGLSVEIRRQLMHSVEGG